MATDATRELSYLHSYPSAQTALEVLSEPVRRWFRERFDQPTSAQRFAWPAIEAGENLLGDIVFPVTTWLLAEQLKELARHQLAADLYTQCVIHYRNLADNRDRAELGRMLAAWQAR